MRYLVAFALAVSAFAQQPLTSPLQDYRHLGSLDFSNARWLKIPYVVNDPSGSCLDVGVIVYSQQSSTAFFCRLGTWTAFAGSGAGSVTSVGLSAPNIFSVSGTPVTNSGTLALALATQPANTVWAGPSSGGPANPAFRAVVIGDIASADKIGNGAKLLTADALTPSTALQVNGSGAIVSAAVAPALCTASNVAGALRLPSGCVAYIGTVPYTLGSNGDVSSLSGTGTITLGLSASGQWHAWHNLTGASCSVINCTNSAVPDGARVLAVATVTAGTLGTIVDRQNTPRSDYNSAGANMTKTPDGNGGFIWASTGGGTQPVMGTWEVFGPNKSDLARLGTPTANKVAMERIFPPATINSAGIEFEVQTSCTSCAVIFGFYSADRTTAICVTQPAYQGAGSPRDMGSTGPKYVTWASGTGVSGGRCTLPAPTAYDQAPWFARSTNSTSPLTRSANFGGITVGTFESQPQLRNPAFFGCNITGGSSGTDASFAFGTLSARAHPRGMRPTTFDRCMRSRSRKRRKRQCCESLPYSSSRSRLRRRRLCASTSRRTTATATRTSRIAA